MGKWVRVEEGMLTWRQVGWGHVV
ncbi:uncharacterized protein G2W53_007041 [Senna tora]|uniref:Uncharacterized protein n=1 Tax=Senna tora TaxID=362788 RepID=A0A835CDT0_9FABA|nr:uncharacterized protein G2W53_007041 [Senna tora]